MPRVVQLREHLIFRATHTDCMGCRQVLTRPAACRVELGDGLQPLDALRRRLLLCRGRYFVSDKILLALLCGFPDRPGRAINLPLGAGGEASGRKSGTQRRQGDIGQHGTTSNNSYDTAQRHTRGVVFDVRYGHSTRNSSTCAPVQEYGSRQGPQKTKSFASRPPCFQNPLPTSGNRCACKHALHVRYGTHTTYGILCHRRAQALNCFHTGFQKPSTMINHHVSHSLVVHSAAAGKAHLRASNTGRFRHHLQILAEQSRHRRVLRRRAEGQS